MSILCVLHCRLLSAFTSIPPAVQALTSNNIEEQAYVLRTMLKLQCGNGLMHESVSTQNLGQCTRPVFEWANAMLVSFRSALPLSR